MPDLARTGILLTNLGSPEAPEPSALRRYLEQFLSDPRIVDLPRWQWWPVLHGIILRTRPKRSAALYQKIWTAEGAPLLAIGRRQRDKLATLLGERTGAPLPVALGMRYGRPSIAEALRELRHKGVQRIIALPLFPQNSCSTTGSTFDAIGDELKAWRFVPALDFIGDYHDHHGYIEALGNSVREAWSAAPPAQKLVFSFHGTPERFRTEGDVYYEQCLTTAKWVAQNLGLSDERWTVVFQSRFGREEWLKPYADETLARLPALGITSVDLICPGFAADCLETLEEMAQENQHLFLSAGGSSYRYIPALNAREDHVQALSDVILSRLGTAGRRSG